MKRGGPLKRRSPLRAKSVSLKRTASKHRLTSIKALKKKAWQAISRFVRARDKRCVTCPNGLAEDAGHFIHNSERSQSLGGNALWYDARGINGQCTGCNRFRSGNLVQYALYLEGKYGPGIIQELNTLYRTHKKWTRDEIEAITVKYTEAFNALALKGLGVIHEERVIQ
jgi:hypothetical protein